MAGGGWGKYIKVSIMRNVKYLRNNNIFLKTVENYTIVAN